MLKDRIESLKKELIDYSLFIQKMFEDSIFSLKNHDLKLSEKILKEMEDFANRKEVEIENECVSIIATNQPVASDLRTLFTILKINNDLERIGDHCVNISSRVDSLKSEKIFERNKDLEKIYIVVKRMFEDSIKSFVNGDINLAKEVLEEDDNVDMLRDKIVKEIISGINKCEGDSFLEIVIMDVARNLERIADLSTNIAEDTIFMITGKSVKHHFEKI
uniref:Phosphate-specific transport system accessory protein PhoU n=1 Tax=candidate division WOR-3 bacterium TaxID=2052148 RepID=A0A7C3J5S1_UNCW3